MEVVGCWNGVVKRAEPWLYVCTVNGPDAVGGCCPGKATAKGLLWGAFNGLRGAGLPAQAYQNTPCLHTRSSHRRFVVMRRTLELRHHVTDLSSSCKSGAAKPDDGGLPRRSAAVLWQLPAQDARYSTTDCHVLLRASAHMPCCWFAQLHTPANASRHTRSSSSSSSSSLHI